MNQESTYTENKTISLTEILNSINEIIYVADQNGTLVNIYGKEAVEPGIKNRNYLSKLVSEIFENDENHIHTSSHHRCLNGESFSYEWELKFNSKTYYYQTLLTPIENNRTKVTGITGVVRNISREKALNRYHQEIELMFKTLTNAAKSAIISVNEEGQIEYCNPVTERMFGYEHNELLGQEFLILFHKEDTIFGNDKDNRVIFNKELSSVENIELLGVKKDGKKIPIECHISLYEIINIKHRVVIIQDISERKLVEEQRKSYQKNLEKKNKEIQDALEYTKKVQDQLVQSEKMASLGALISGIAHEINNPLAFVSSNHNRFGEYFSDLFDLLDKWKDLGFNMKDSDQFSAELSEINLLEEKIDYKFIKDDCEELLKHNFEGIDRIKNIVLQLRGFSHVSDDNAIEVDINKAIEETLTIVWNELKYKATIKKYYGKLPLVQCQAGEIKQIFVNLLVNASHAIETRGEIIIETCRDDTNVIIKISDTGKGMSAEIKRKIFDPFFTTKDVGEGTGLGLWICMSIIQKHHGKLEVESKEGKGSTFKITLPIEFENQ